jgi:hypothetical protein
MLKLNHVQKKPPHTTQNPRDTTHQSTPSLPHSAPNLHRKYLNFPSTLPLRSSSQTSQFSSMPSNVLAGSEPAVASLVTTRISICCFIHRHWMGKYCGEQLSRSQSASGFDVFIKFHVHKVIINKKSRAKAECGVEIDGARREPMRTGFARRMCRSEGS